MPEISTNPASQKQHVLLPGGLLPIRGHMTLEEELRAERKALRADIESVKTEMTTALINFDYVSDPELVDLFVYKIKSAHMRYDHLLKKAKQML